MIDTSMLEAAVQDLRGLLHDSLIATDIWERKDGLSLAGFNQQPAAVALFNRITDEIVKSLRDSGFPPLHRYYLLDIDGEHAMAVLNHGRLLQGIFVDKRAGSLGILVSVAIPRMLEAVARAAADRPAVAAAAVKR